MERVIEGRSLRKSYGSRIAVQGVDLDIYKGECFGLLGPNGAGKSSLLRMLYGGTSMASGELFILGMNAESDYLALKRSIGVVPQEDGLDPDFSVLDNLRIYASYFGIDKAEANDRAIELLKFMKIEEYALESVDNLSGGMRRRLALARGLINNPEVIFLDEPTTGLDPQVRSWIWDRLRILKETGKTLFLSTHYMDEAERLCDRVAIMHKGVFLDIAPPAELIAKHIGHTVIEMAIAPDDLEYYSTRLKELGVETFESRNQISVFLKDEDVSPEDIIKVVPSEGYSVRRASLDDVFLRLAGHELQS